jgi:LacI family transcriptional regulator
MAIHYCSAALRPIDTEKDILSSFVQRRADGLVVTSGARENAEFYRAVAESRVPAVLVERDSPDSLDHVVVDHAAGVAEATRHLLTLGHTRIALVTGPREVTPARSRAEGFRRAHAEFGVAVEPSLVIHGAFWSEFGQETAVSLLRAPLAPTALIAGGNLMLPGVLRAVRQLGLAVPSDLSLVAVSDSPLAELSQPPIGIVRWSFGDLGRAAARLLLTRLGDHGSRPRHVMIPTEFLPRGTCAAPLEHS